MSAYFLSTPIYYVNDVPHVGHAYTTIAADALTRSRRLRGLDAFLLTGTDEHGQNIERVARERGIPAQQHVDEIAARFQELWRSLDIEYNRFIRTTDPLHERGVLRLWEKLRRSKLEDGRDVVYPGIYAGWYCPRCEAFYEEDELKQPDNTCPVHERPCEWTEEENFFFRLSAYAPWLEAEIGTDRIRVEPVGRKNEVLSVIRSGLQDFSVSRARVKWGIRLPDRPDHVLYVWVDALLNYITALEFADEGPLYQKYWVGAQERFHLIGKDIIRFHCIYWPAILHAAGLPVPTRLFAQGWITKNGKKLSKTTGNVIDPVQLVSDFGPDVVRYFLLREGVYGQDWDFTDEALVRRYNADLANDLGNLVSRALTMVVRYCEGRIPARPSDPTESEKGLAGSLSFEEHLQSPVGAEGDRVMGTAEHLARKVLDKYEELDFAGALGEVWGWVSRLNQRIVEVSPWELAKDPSRKGELEAFLYRLLEAVRLAAVLVAPVMPRAADRILEMLGAAGSPLGPEDLKWGRLQPGTALRAPAPLFPRREDRGRAPGKEVRVSDTPAPPPPSPPPPGPAPIDIAEFSRVELRVAEIKEAEAIPGSKRLVRLQVDLGDERRQVVAGIAESYTPQALLGKKVVVVANLKPARLMGVESNGMVLAASADGRAVLCSFDADVAPGTKVK